MLYRENVVDNIDHCLITEEYINQLNKGVTLDYLLGRACGMFQQHIVVNDINDDMIDELKTFVNPKVVHKLVQDIEFLLPVTKEFFIHIDDGYVYNIHDWTPSCVFIEGLSLDFGIEYVTYRDNDGCIVTATINPNNIRQNIASTNVSHTYFEANGTTYSEAMCKCILKYYYDLGWA